MTDLSSISAESLAAVSSLADELPHGETVALDPSNPAHRAAIEAGLAAAGRTQDRYPALYAALDSAGGGGDDHLAIIDNGVDGSGRATALSVHASPSGALYNGGTLFAMDGDSGELLALGHNSSVRQGFVPVSTDTASAGQAGSALKSVSLNYSMSAEGEAQFTVTVNGVEVTSGGADVTVTIPTQTPIHTNPTYVSIGLNRSSAPADCDYWYNDNNPNNPNPNLIVPFVGNAVLPYEIAGTPGQPISGATLFTQIYYQQSGTTYTVAMNTTYTQNFAGKVTMDASDSSKLDWNYAYVAGSAYNNTPAIVYNAASAVNDLAYSYFYYTFEIPVNNAPTPTFAFNVCSVNTPNEQSLQCFNIPNLKFTWHCLAEGTKVALADGGGAMIQELTSDHRVLTGDGDMHLAVEATTRGTHSAAADHSIDRAVYRLVTDGGHELVGSALHTVRTPDGLVPLYALSAGDKVAVDKGMACVEEIGPIDFDGALYNIKLGDEGDRANGLPADAVCTFIANGIVVGDHEAQRNENNRLARDVEHMKTVLPDHLHDDYASAVADIRY